MEKSNKDLKNVLQSSSKLASYNMILQLSFRVLTFLLNAFILRYVTKDILGIVNVRLVLLYGTIIFMSREAFRRACLSTETSSSADKGGHSKALYWSQTINLLWCMIPVGLVCMVLLIYCWAYLFENPDPLAVPYYGIAVLVFGFCAWIELFAEPLWIIGQTFLFVKLKVISEGLAILVKTIVTVLLVVWYPQWGLISFCCAMVAFSITYIAVYYGYFFWFITSGKVKQIEDFPIHSVRDFFPKLHLDVPLVNINAAKLTVSFFKQSVLKGLLTEGERYIMTVLNVLSFADQGVYDIVNNLGSLVARFIFLPIEESFYLFFVKTLKRGEDANQQTPNQVLAISHVLFCLLRLVVLIGSTILAFGLPYSYLLLDLYGGTILSSGTGPLLLKFYCLYVLVIAINGTTECFVFAAMSQNEVENYNKKMLLFSFLFLTTSYYLTILVGSVGFILANCLNMLARIIHSIIFLKRFYKKSRISSPLHGLIPRPVVLVTLAVSFLICSFSESQLCCHRGWIFRVVHISVGAICLCAVAVSVFYFEREVVTFLREQYFSKSAKNQNERVSATKSK
ncbi:man(5)GlcNAc(2)-PP-dolichol translocation protein RFT1-like [Clavelina lepadiformis]|uniref:man(5)GlcNAc(2)-PP-dolichol translocation protein RFT1-like n=1 Tax=Clavelina lepadiformis TaxID=159417 RepID=UPI004040F4C4